MVSIERNDASVISLDQMHDVADVVMNAVHASFAGKTLDASTLGFTLVLCGVSVLKNAEFDHIKERFKDFIDGIDLAEIAPFEPSRPA